MKKKKSKDEYFNNLNQTGYRVGSHFPTFESEGLMYDIIKEPMDSVRKKDNYTSTLTHESTGMDNNDTYPHDTNDYNNLENSGYSVINQNDTNLFSLEGYEKPSLTYLEDGSGDFSFSSKPDNILTYQQQQQYNNYSNNTQVHYVLRQPNYETQYNTRSTLYPYSYYNGEFYL